MSSFKDFFVLFNESKEIANNLKNRNKEEVYKLASDIRKHIEDYPDINLFDIIEENQEKQLFHHFPIKTKDKIYTHYYNPNSLEYLENNLKYYKDQLQRNIESNNSYWIQQAQKRIMDSENAIKKYIPSQILVIDKKEYFKEVLSNAKYGSREYRTYMLSKDKNISQNLSDSLIKQFVSSLFDRIKNKNDFKKYELTNSDKKILLKELDITTPMIYNYLIKISYNLPKHPSELPKEFLDAPKFIINPLANGKSLIDIATDSCRITSGNFSGNCQILNPISNETTYNITNKEASEWVKHEIQYLKKLKQQSKSYEAEFGAIIQNDEFANFPSYLLDKTPKNENARTKLNYENMSFSSIKVFRWFLHNINSVYFYKPKTIHGPANQENEFLPISHIVNITDDDLDNGIKTSPEKAFNNASTRKAREFENNNKDSQFRYDKEYTDTDKVKVIRNSKALEYEGKRMDHCVGGYSSSCLSKRSLILHLPHSTAELNPQTLDVYQHRGRGNSSPSEEDVGLLDDWIKQNQS